MSIAPHFGHFIRIVVGYEESATGERITEGVQNSIRRNTKFETKIGVSHSDIFLFGIGFGLEDLTEEELADFFNAYCWCGKDHDGKGLRKQSRRMLRNFTAVA